MGTRSRIIRDVWGPATLDAIRMRMEGFLSTRIQT